MTQQPAWPTAALVEAYAAQLAAVEASMVRIEAKLDQVLDYLKPVIVFEIGDATDKEI